MKKQKQQYLVSGLIVCIIYAIGANKITGEHNIIYCFLIPEILCLILWFLKLILKIKKKYNILYGYIGILIYDLVTLFYYDYYGIIENKRFISSTLVIIGMIIIYMIASETIKIIKINKKN